jgi:hypothetical protein
MVMRRRVIAAIAALTATLLLITALRADAHPLHTTLTEVSITPGTNVVRAVVRVFADDLASATGARSTTDVEVVSYIAGALSILDENGRRLAGRGCGVTRTGDLVWVCVDAAFTGSAARLSLRNGVLSERFKDQINIVQATLGAAKRSVVFTKGDGPKRLF